MANAVHQFEPEDEVLKGVDEVDWTEDPVDDEVESLFDVNELECVDECDDQRKPKNERNIVDKNRSQRRNDRKRRQSYNNRSGERRTRRRIEPSNITDHAVEKETPEEHNATIPPFDDLELVDSCDADEDEDIIQPSTSHDCNQSISDSKQYQDLEDGAGSPVSDYDDEGDSSVEYEEDFPFLDESIDVEAMKKASMLNSDPPSIRLNSLCGDGPWNGISGRMSGSTNNTESSRTSCPEQRDDHNVMATTTTCSERFSPESVPISRNERERNRVTAASPSKPGSPQKREHIFNNRGSSLYPRTDKNRVTPIKKRKDKRRRRDKPSECLSNGGSAKDNHNSSVSSNVPYSRNKFPERSERGNPRRDGGASSNFLGNRQNVTKNNNTHIGSNRNHSHSFSIYSPSNASHVSSNEPLIVQVDSKRGRRTVRHDNIRNRQNDNFHRKFKKIAG